jgi:pyrroloquinoline quinone (PQQ) biosynthesis protein C
MPTLRRTVPFLARSRVAGVQEAESGRVLLVDSVEIPLSAPLESLQPILRRPLCLGAADQALPADTVEYLVEAQYQACLESIYGHPVWERFREGQAHDVAHAYLLESRHYLAAAPFRMASGVSGGLTPSALARLQAHHMIEEADHDIYFENGLAALGYPRPLIRAARPSPVTIEWIHLMRTVAEYGPLTAAICSGLLEYTAGDRDAVTGWHSMLVARGVLPQETVSAIFEHVETDLGLGHGSNWRDAIHAAKIVPAEHLAEALNATTLVAEMIVRWLDTFETGLSPEVVRAAPGLRLDEADPRLGGEADGLPVWPAEIYRSYAHGAASGRPGTRRALALAYAYGGRVSALADPETPDAGGRPSAASAAADLTVRVAHTGDGGGGAELDKLVTGWMTAIDGHELWQRMLDAPSYPLVWGWMVENYHYVSGIWQHTGAAISTCPDPVIRAELVKHLIEEFNHGRMFLQGINRACRGRTVGLPPDQTRPLATTAAFVGTLRELGQRDWKAYALGLAFLQLTLSAGEQGVAARHTDFYQTLFAQLPEAEPLVAAMRHHDEEDTRLGHGDDTRTLLRLLASRHEIGADVVSAAALVPALAWSFLDGVLRHYEHGEAAMLQRLGWHVSG